MDEELRLLEDTVLTQMEGKFSGIPDEKARKQLVTGILKSLSLSVSKEDVDRIIADMNDFYPIEKYLADESIEDIMINNTRNIFIYREGEGSEKLKDSIDDQGELNQLVNKLKLYATNEIVKGSILDVHLPNGSRANIITSPMGYNITIRNFKKQPMSILDLINREELDYQLAARFWLYVDGLHTRPANLLIGGMPASGKTTLLNALFSFFRPEQRIVTIEETYELDTSTQENCVQLETDEDMTMEELVKNALRMRPDMIIVGEVRGAEASDMITAMNVGKISMGTIHASSTRDIINRLTHTPMNVPMDIIPVIDALVVVSTVYSNGTPTRKITQISEISGIETQVLLSDLYKYDYKTHLSSTPVPTVTYRDVLSKLLAISPADIMAEERVRASILEKLNKLGKRDMKSMSEAVKDYYDNPDAMLKKIGLGNMEPAVRI
jgi:flagellar protein FlaI